MPGMYRVVCAELQLDNLAVNTVLNSKGLDSIEGVDALSKAGGIAPYCAKLGDALLEDDDMLKLISVLRQFMRRQEQQLILN